jgi:hypothetical protein
MAENRFFTIYVNSKAPRHARTENRRCRALSHRRLLAAFGFGPRNGFGVDINGRKSIFYHLCQLQTTWTCQDRKSAVQGPSHRRLLVAFGFGARDRFGVEINGRKSFFLPFMSTPKPLDMPGPKIGGAGPCPIAVYMHHSGVLAMG